MKIGLGGKIKQTTLYTDVCPFCGRSDHIKIYKLRNYLKWSFLRFPGFHKKLIGVCGACAGHFIQESPKPRRYT